MMRALWTAASGMVSQQTNVDVIANNLSNVNTIGYKKESAQFKSLLYQTIQSKTTSANGETKPVGAQVGLGVRTASITTNFKQGSTTATELTTDFAIDGKGFFQVMNENGETLYTRAGSFNWSLGNNGGVMLCNSEGLPVLDTAGQPIDLDPEYDTSKITIEMFVIQMHKTIHSLLDIR
jgi:flagellar basal-body rod protein FlgG